MLQDCGEPSNERCVSRRYRIASPDVIFLRSIHTLFSTNLVCSEFGSCLGAQNAPTTSGSPNAAPVGVSSPSASTSRSSSFQFTSPSQNTDRDLVSWPALLCSIAKNITARTEIVCSFALISAASKRAGEQVNATMNSGDDSTAAVVSANLIAIRDAFLAAIAVSAVPVAASTPSDSSGVGNGSLTPGGIAGIAVAAAILLLIIIVLIVVLIVKRRKNSAQKSSPATRAMPMVSVPKSAGGSAERVRNQSSDNDGSSSDSNSSDEEEEEEEDSGDESSDQEASTSGSGSGSGSGSRSRSGSGSERDSGSEQGSDEDEDEDEEVSGKSAGSGEEDEDGSGSASRSASEEGSQSGSVVEGSDDGSAQEGSESGSGEQSESLSNSVSNS